MEILLLGLLFLRGLRWSFLKRDQFGRKTNKIGEHIIRALMDAYQFKFHAAHLSLILNGLFGSLGYETLKANLSTEHLFIKLLNYLRASCVQKVFSQHGS